MITRREIALVGAPICAMGITIIVAVLTGAA
jgi:hypothetical protein